MGVSPVSTYTPPDFETQSGTQYKTNLDNSIGTGERLVRNFAPHGKTIPDMNVLIDAGSVFNDNSFSEQSQQTVGPITAPVSNPRIDRIVIDNLTGVATRIAGTEAGSPVAPAIPDEKTPICQISLTVGMTAITNAQITDERIAGSPSSVIVKYRSTADITIANDGAELDLMVPYPVPGGLLGTNKTLHGILLIRELDIPGGDTCTIRVKYGATTLVSFIAGPVSGITNGVGMLRIELFADGATNAQLAWVTLEIAETTGVVAVFEKKLGTSSIDSTVNQDLKVTADHNATSVNNKIVQGRVQLIKE